MPSVDISRLAENPHESVHGLRADTTTRGVDLAGTKVIATYDDGTTEVLTWEAFDPYTNGGAVGTDVSMSFGNNWHALTATKLLKSLQFDLQPASSIFDTTITSDDDPAGGSTPGSKEGFPFRVSPEYQDLSGEIAVTYSGITNLAGSPAEGDIYTTMLIDFSNLDGGGLLGDLEWNSDIDTMEVPGDLVPTGATCLVRGSLITTDQGDLPIEMLRPGHKVLTMDHGYQALRMVLNRIVGPLELGINPKLYPIRINARALGAGLPKRDLIVSRQHRMVAKSSIAARMFGERNVLVSAIRLADLPGINVDTTFESVEYFHLLFENHEVIFAEGTPTESFLLCPETRRSLPPAAWAEFVTLFPEAAEPDTYPRPARVIPPSADQKRLVQRHIKNAKPVIDA